MGNKKKLKGGDLRNYERDNMLGFGTGLGSGDEWAPCGSGGLKASLQFISLSSKILRKSTNGIGVDFCKTVKCPQQLMLSKCLAWRKSIHCPDHHCEMGKQGGKKITVSLSSELWLCYVYRRIV